MTPGALQKLCAYHWPGNVRELENTVERARVLAPGGIIDEAEIDFQRGPENTAVGWAQRAPIEDGWKKCLATLEKSLVERAMTLAGGNKSKAAETLQIHRRLLYDKLREYGLKADSD
jgi:DNA-binding NtrC family response regulator